jgi:hypothetical protein
MGISVFLSSVNIFVSLIKQYINRKLLNKGKNILDDIQKIEESKKITF